MTGAEGPPFFIIGSARSGTTLLRLMFNAHPDVAVPPESRFVVELWDGRDEVVVASWLDALAAHKRFGLWDLPIEAVAAELGPAERVPYADAVVSAFRAYARVHGKKRWGDKTPRYIEHIPLLARLWPEARFVHLIRDGRNVALSYGDVPFGPKTIPQCARLWAQRVKAGIRDGRALGTARYLEVRYERLVEDAKAAAVDICSFLDLEFDPGMLDYTDRARDALLPRATQFNPHVTEPPRAGMRSWESEMSPRDIEIFEAVAGRVLDEAGYERRYPDPSLGAQVVGSLGRWLPLARVRRRAG